MGHPRLPHHAGLAHGRAGLPLRARPLPGRAVVPGKDKKKDEEDATLGSSPSAGPPASSEEETRDERRDEQENRSCCDRDAPVSRRARSPEATRPVAPPLPAAVVVREKHTRDDKRTLLLRSRRPVSRRARSLEATRPVAPPLPAAVASPQRRRRSRRREPKKTITILLRSPREGETRGSSAGAALGAGAGLTPETKHVVKRDTRGDAPQMTTSRARDRRQTTSAVPPIPTNCVVNRI